MRTRVRGLGAVVGLVLLMALPGAAGAAGGGAAGAVDAGAVPALAAAAEDCVVNGDRLAPCEIVVTGRDGITRSVDAPPAALLAWFPDGRRLLVARVEDGEQVLSEVAVHDGAQRRLATVPADAEVTLSPLGDRVALTVSVGDVLVVDLATGAERVIGVPDAALGPAPQWSPDGARLALPAAVGAALSDPSDAGLPGVVVVDVEAGSSRALTVPRLEPACDGGQPTEAALFLAWSPTGDRVALSTDLGNGSPCGFRTAIVPLDGGPIADLGASTRVDAPAWSPDGALFAFVTGGINASPSRTGYARADGTVVGYAATDDDDAGISGIGWTPDGAAHLAVVLGARPDGPPVGTVHAFDPAAATGETPAEIPGTAVPGLPGFGLLAPGAVTRAAGLSRVDTAVAVSRTTWESSTSVVVAPSASYAEPLAAAPLAGRDDAPVLLTGADLLAPQVAVEIARLGATTAYLAGGEAVLTAQVETDLAALGLDVERLGGDGPFATAAAIATEVGGTSAYVVEGVDQDPARGWPDAVSMSGLAALTEVPVLLVGHDRLPDETAAAIEDLAVESVTVIGGADAVSDAVVDQIAALGATVDRAEGATRYGTSAAVAGLAEAAGAAPATTWVAAGTDFPDSLTAGPAAAHEGAVLVLADRDQLSASAETAALLAPPRLQRVRLAGGPRALTGTLELELERRLPWP